MYFRRRPRAFLNPADRYLNPTRLLLLDCQCLALGLVQAAARPLLGLAQYHHPLEVDCRGYLRVRTRA